MAGSDSDLTLVLHHIYANGMACDVSGYNNHGLPYGVTNANPGFAYAEPTSRVVVPPSGSLSNLVAVSTGCIFSLTEGYAWTLMDAAGCFGIRITSEHGLSGWIVLPDGTQAVIGTRLGVSFISQNTQHQVELFYDGTSQASLYLDGTEVASTCVGAGPMGSIGAGGITIGSPPIGQAGVAGNLYQSWLYKFDPLKAAKSILNPKCPGYLEALDAMSMKLRRRGFTNARTRAKGMQMIRFALNTANTLFGSDRATYEQVSELALQALAAFKAGNSTAYSNAFAQIAGIIAGRITPAQVQALQSQKDALFGSLPLPAVEFEKLLAQMCLRRAKASPIDAVEAVWRATGRTSLTQAQINAVIAETTAEETRIGQ